MASKKHKSLIGRLLAQICGADQAEAERARLEAFLAAVPGEYCGFSAEGTPAFSRGFAEILKLRRIENLQDIQNCLAPGSAAALESMATRLRERSQGFSIVVETFDGEKTLKLSGARGYDLSGEDRYDVYWVEDITDETWEKKRLETRCEKTAEDLQRLQGALDRVAFPLWMRNEDTEFVWCNKAYADSLDSTPATVIARQLELSTTAARKGKGGTSRPLRALAKDAIKEDETKTLRSHSIIKGKRRLLDITETPIAEFRICFGTGRDVTREEELESELKRYVSANKELLEQLRTAISIFGADQKLEFYNSAFAQLWDLNDQWLNSQPRLSEIMEKLRETRRLPEQADFRKYKQSWLTMFTSLIDPHEDMLHLPDGSALRMLAIPHPMGGLMMTFEDVTSRLELESSYNTLIAVQKETLDNLAEGVVVFGSDGRIKLWNPSYARMWGLNPEDLDGEPHITRIIDKRANLFEAPSWDEQRDRMVKLGLERRQKEGRVIRRDGSVLDYTTVPLPDGGVLISWADVTDTVRVENALREKNAALETAERLKLDFLANVSYQLRTPLSAIMGFTEILDKEYFGELNSRQKEYTKSMYEASERLLGLINDILDLSTIEAGYLSLELEEIRVRKMLARLLDLVREWARKEHVDIELDCPRDIGAITADERRLKQVLLNLIRNAISFTPQGGKIRLAVTRDDAVVTIIVSDTGVGIKPEDQERIFQPFERVQNVTRQDGVTARGGAGLGLSLVKNIIELHGGTIAIKSEPGRGTDVIIRLPQPDGKSGKA